ncbi:hypothetical protein AB0P17_20760 [Streptomyces sp. NPDC088124]|uniref:hypothetical protein n=1 Tax=Streptomyces sp. NPDC088124 TaxID=3154654 RepID=UPI00342502C5
MYWLSQAELHSWAASNASDLNDPRRALTHYAAVATSHHDETYDDDACPRSRALRLSREADAHLSLRDVDAAVNTADQAVGGVTSARGTTVLTDLRTKLRAHQQLPEVREFLDRTV